LLDDGYPLRLVLLNCVRVAIPHRYALIPAVFAQAAAQGYAALRIFAQKSMTRPDPPHKAVFSKPPADTPSLSRSNSLILERQ